MKIILKSLLLSITALTLTQPAAAMDVKNIATNKYTLATLCAVTGYVTSNFLDKKLKNVISDKSASNTDTATDTKNKTKFNENMKALREAIQISGPALIEAQMNHYKLGSPLNSYLLVNSFNFYQSAETVINKLISLWQNKPAIDYAETGKTLVYAIAGVSQTLVPNYVKDQRIKPFVKYFTRSVLNKALEAVFLGDTTLTTANLDQKKFNESIKDLVDFGINGGPLVKGLFA